jgi:hypothetical protein
VIFHSYVRLPEGMDDNGSSSTLKPENLNVQND